MSDDLLPRFLAACDACGLDTGGTVVVAVSGGADSLALWALCVQAHRWPVVIYHLDHGLRADACRDAELIRHRAGLLSTSGMGPVAVVCEQEDVAALAVRWRCSLETAGRRHRYVRLEAVARAHGAAAVLTAHHADDQIETVLFNLLRGAGPRGAAGIPPHRPLACGITLARPLLGFRRQELRAFAAAQGWTWNEDGTNADPRFTRNWLRLHILPDLERGVPGFGEELLRSAGRWRMVSDGDEEAVESLWRQALGPDDLQIEAVRGQPERLRLALWRRLLAHLLLPLARRHLRRLDDLMRGTVGRRMHLGSWLLVRREHAIAWTSSRAQEGLPGVGIPGPGDYHRGHIHLSVWTDEVPVALDLPPDEACLAVESVHFPLEWRVPRQGERWVAFGAPGSQTVLRWLANRGVPAPARPVHAVLADADGVVWIPGQTIAERCRVRLETRQVLRLSMADTSLVRD